MKRTGNPLSEWQNSTTAGNGYRLACGYENQAHSG
jgi:hypothetical protein